MLQFSHAQTGENGGHIGQGRNVIAPSSSAKAAGVRGRTLDPCCWTSENGGANFACFGDLFHVTLVGLLVPHDDSSAANLLVLVPAGSGAGAGGRLFLL